MMCLERYYLCKMCRANAPGDSDRKNSEGICQSLSVKCDISRSE